MKKLFFTIIVFASFANVSAQIDINSSGQVGIKTASPQYDLHVVGNTFVTGNIVLGGSASNFFGTNNAGVPITLKLNNVLAGYTGHSGSTSVSFGYQALRNSSQGSYNVAVGVEALYSNTIGSFNTANGYQSLYNNTTTSFNTANGCQALYFNTGANNTADGYKALYNNKGGGGNSATGMYAMYSNTTGSYNTANGHQAMYSNTTGSSNTAIGMNADVVGGDLSNATAIGYGAAVNESNKVVIGNTNVMKIVAGNNLISLSDGRTKKNIRSEVPGLSFINRLQPVMYNLDLNILDELLKSGDQRINHVRDSLLTARSPEEKAIEAKARANKEKIVYSGFIAQDVETAARSVGYDFSGVDAPEGGKGAYGLRYAEFVVPLVKAVQELSEQNDYLQKRVDELTVLVNKLLGNENGSSLRNKAE